MPWIDNKSLATKLAAYLLVNPLIIANPAIVSNVVNNVSNVIITRSTPTVAATNTEPTSLLNSTIYNDSKDDLLVTLLTSI